MTALKKEPEDNDEDLFYSKEDLRALTAVFRWRCKQLARNDERPCPVKADGAEEEMRLLADLYKGAGPQPGLAGGGLPCDAP